MCRCTGYVKIVDAVQAAARGEVDTAATAPRRTVAEGCPA